MKAFNSVEVRVSKLWLHFGYSFARFAIGFSVDRWSASIDLGPFWISIEY
jgi:hypothetical protein